MVNNLLGITFDANILDGGKLTNKTYIPYMSIPSLYDNNKMYDLSGLFIPLFELTKDRFGTMTEDDIKNIFVDEIRFNDFTTKEMSGNYINQVPVKSSTTLADAVSDGIIDTNITFLLNLFFKNGSKFYFEKEYVINKLVYDNQIKSMLGNKVNIQIQLDLHKYIIDSTILKIKFDASTIDGLISKDTLYTPTMSNPTIYASFPNILFIPTIKLSRNLFDKALSNDDIKKIFLSSTQFASFKKNLRINKHITTISIDDAVKSNIIHNNVVFLLGLFFKKGESLYLNNKTQYVINNYIWDNKFIKKPTSFDLNTEVKVSFVLHKGDKLSFIDSTRLNCLRKREDIVKDYYKLLGKNPPIVKLVGTVDTSTTPTTPTTPVRTIYPGDPISRTYYPYRLSSRHRPLYRLPTRRLGGNSRTKSSQTKKKQKKQKQKQTKTNKNKKII